MLVLIFLTCIYCLCAPIFSSKSSSPHFSNFWYIAGNCTSGEVQLVDGKSKYEGRLEVCYEGSWTSLCSYGVNSRVAAVVCRQLNFTTIGIIV